MPGNIHRDSIGYIVRFEFQITVGFNINIKNAFHIDRQCLCKPVKIHRICMDHLKGSGCLDLVIHVSDADHHMMLIPVTPSHRLQSVIYRLIVDQDTICQ